ncbi:hypothetical protein Asp14428_17420 [Actinoplanes sp. NBRC 14428]|nr:hypothetical protein Asp14428_17420 [Actinoplanes sp. NBRC 14428]
MQEAAAGDQPVELAALHRRRGGAEAEVPGQPGELVERAALGEQVVDGPRGDVGQLLREQAPRVPSRVAIARTAPSWAAGGSWCSTPRR